MVLLEVIRPGAHDQVTSIKANHDDDDDDDGDGDGDGDGDDDDEDETETDLFHAKGRVQNTTRGTTVSAIPGLPFGSPSRRPQAASARRGANPMLGCSCRGPAMGW